MKHITFAEKSLLVGDEAADILIAYAALLARVGSADVVTLNAIGADGHDVTASFLLDQGASLITETTGSHLAEPDNTEEIARMREQIALIETPPHAMPAGPRAQPYGSSGENDWDDPNFRV